MRNGFVCCLGVLLLTASLVSAKTVQVGPTRSYTTVSAGYNAAAAGDTIEIDSGTYTGAAGWVTINTNNLTIRGVGATRPVLDAAGGATASKGIFVVYATNLTVENLEFKNAYISAGQGLNAAGIRYQPSTSPSSLTVRSCYFHDNQNGILGGDTGSTVLFENTEFNHNGAGDGYSHNMYIGANTFTLRYCYVHNANVGHEVKTRAKVNNILYNRISNETGSASRELQLANGGPSFVIGNVIYQGNGGNSQIITYGDEYNISPYANPNPYLYIVNNTIVNQRDNGAQFIYVADTAATVLIQNNIFAMTGYGNETILSGPGSQVTNWQTISTNAGFANQAGFDYHLTPASTGAINAGTAPGMGFTPNSSPATFTYPLTPIYQYIHPCNKEVRPTSGTIDIGAYEYVVPNQPPTVNAGVDQNVYEGAAVSLHATASDPNNDPLTYAWTQPAGLNVTLSGAATADASFTAPVVSTITQASMTFTVTVSDTKATPVSDSVNVRVWMRGDVNRDNHVDTLDLLALAGAWGSATGNGSYNVLCDLNNDGTVDVVDLLILADNWGRVLP